ncbi:MAG: hypothetical protein Q8M29_02585 [Bacteroidota bacterium]|nr:hypothetical protein [Bacteroidota bacterium]
MIDLEWGKIITVFVLSAVKLGLAGAPAAVFAFKFSFLETLVICSSGGIFGVFVFTYLIDGILKGLNLVFNKYLKGRITRRITIFLDKHFPGRNKRKTTFNRKNRFIIRAKRNFGLIGIAIISPVILSIPLGVFLAIRFFKDKKKIILWMSASVVFWTVVLYMLFHFFHSTFEGYFS